MICMTYCVPYCTLSRKVAHGVPYPHDFPEYNGVYCYFRIWSKKDETGKSLIDRILAELVILERLSHNKEPKPTMLIVDSKSIQNADTAEVRGI